MRDITLSVVSHGQNALVNQLLEDIRRYCADRVALVLTENIPDPTPLVTGALSGPVERIWCDRSYHVVTQDYDREIVFDATVGFATKVTAAG